MRQVCPYCKCETFYVDETGSYDYSSVDLICSKCGEKTGVYCLKFSHSPQTDLIDKDPNPDLNSSQAGTSNREDSI